MLDWMLGAQGTAVATWLSSIIGSCAIVIAVFAYVNDRRRAREDAAQDRCRRLQTIVDFLEQATVGFKEAYIDVQSVKEQVSLQVEAQGLNATPTLDVTDLRLRWKARQNLIGDLRRAAAVLDAPSALIFSRSDEAISRIAQHQNLGVYMSGGLLSFVTPIEAKLRELVEALDHRVEVARNDLQQLQYPTDK